MTPKRTDLEKTLNITLTPEQRAIVNKEMTSGDQQVRILDPEKIRKSWARLAEDNDTLAEIWERRIASAVKYSEVRRITYYLHKLMREGKGAFRNLVRRGRAGGQSALGYATMPSHMPRDLMREVNRCLPILEEAIAEVQAEKITLEVTARTGSIEDENAARIASKMVDLWDDNLNLQKVFADALYDGATNGPMIIKEEWDHRGISRIKVDGQEFSGPFGDHRSTRVDPSNLFAHDKLASLDEASWVVEKMEMRRADLERAYPNVAVLDLGTKDTLGFGRADWLTDVATDIVEENDLLTFGTSAVDADRLTDDDIFVVWDCYERFWDEEIGAMLWYRTVICDGVVLEKGPYMPMREEVDENGKVQDVPIVDSFGQPVVWPLPYILECWIPSATQQTWGIGLVRAMMEALRKLEWASTVTDKMAHDSSVMAIALHEDDTITHAYDDGMMFIRYGGEVPKRLDFGTIPASIQQFMDRHEQQLERASLRPPVTRGEAKAGWSNKAINTLLTQVTSAYSNIFLRFHHLKRRVYSRRLMFAQALYRPERTMQITEEGAQSVMTFSQANLRDHIDVRLNIGPLFGINKMARIELMQMLTQSGLLPLSAGQAAVEPGKNENPWEPFQRQRTEEQRIINRIKSLGQEACQQILNDVAKEAMRVRQQAQAGQFGEESMRPIMESQRTLSEIMDNDNIGIMEEHEDYLEQHRNTLIQHMTESTFRDLEVTTPAIAAVIRLRLKLIRDKMAEAQLRMAAAQVDGGMSPNPNTQGS